MPPVTEVSSHHRLRVLLVEDDEGDALLVQEYLDLSGASCDVHWVTEIRMLAEVHDRFDCVVLDLHLPDAHGVEALLAVQEVQPAPVVVLTGLDDEATGLQAVAAGAEDYLVKGSIDASSLSRAVRFAIERRRADDATLRLAEAEWREQRNLRLARGLFPRPLVDDPRLAWTVRYRPGGGGSLLGGDFFDAIESADGRVHVVIGDVAGHGPDEAALGVALRNGWRSLVLAGLEPGQVLVSLEALLRSETEEFTFATACQLSIDPDRRHADVVLAGHPPPLLLGSPGAEEVGTGRRGVPLGMSDGGGWGADRIDLPETWTLVLYTDGLVEGRDPDGPDGRWGVEGLVAALGSTRPGPTEAAGLLDDLIHRAEALNGGELTDDVAVMLLHCLPADDG
jgi:serine phosphatase RsbU (regulator of sigma subunit)